MIQRPSRHGPVERARPAVPRRLRNRTGGGFTLIELLITIVIVGILAQIAFSKFFYTKDRAFKATLQSDLRNMAVAQEAYYDANQRYASTLGQLSSHITSSLNVTIQIDSATATGWGAQATHSGSSWVCRIATSTGGNRLGAPVCTLP
ncbi:MAG: type IV pilin protein [Gemmatimonadota bacterium]